MSAHGPLLPGLLGRAAAAEPDRVAVAVEGGDRLTYREWADRSDALARGLRRAVGPGDRVALRFDATRWHHYAVAYLAVHKAAAVAVPLGPALGDIEFRRILSDCEASAVVAPSDLAPRSGSVPNFDPCELDPGELGDEAPEEPLTPGVPAAALAEVLYASGPLSRPVPVARSHAAVLAGPPPRFDPGAAGRCLLHAFQVGTLAGQAALASCLAPAPVRSVVLPAFDPDRLCALLETGPIPACGLHPSTARALLDSGAPARHDLSRVGCLVVASGRVSPALLPRLRAAFPSAALLLADVLGHPAGVPASFSHDRGRPGALGRPVGETAIRIADESGRSAAQGQVGRVRVRAAPLGGERRGANGEDGEQDAPSDRLGWIDDRGLLYAVAGREEVVRRRGAPVLRLEVEGALREHRAVVDAALVGVPDDQSGPELAAVVVLGRPVPAAELQELVAERLGPDKRPDRVIFVDELPRDRHGALLRGKLRRGVGLAVDGDEPSPVPAAVQETVAAVCARVLGRDDIEPGDDLFELGGATSAAASALRLLEDAFELRAAPSTLSDAATVAGLASAVVRLRPVGDDARPLPPVAFSQEGMLWHELFAPGCQNLPGLARRYRGPLDVAALSRALDEIVQRHGALRTGFELREGRAVQVVRPHRPLDLAIRDLTHLAAGERKAEVGRAVAEAGQRPFDLVVDPLFEPALLRLGPDDHVLVIRTHHSVFDDWSVGVFRRELASLYAAYVAKDASPLPEAPVQFADFSRRQRAALAGRAGTRQLSYWRRELAGAPLATQLPVDDPEAPEGSPQAAGEPVSLALGPELHDGLRALARRQRATVFMTVLAAFGVLVHRCTGQDDLVLATVVANRNRTELEGVIGCFTKKLPLRLRLGGDPTFGEVVARTRTALLGALAHQDLPFEAVVQDVLGAPAASHGLAPHLALMFQGVTPRRELVLPGVETVGMETAASARRAHFMATDEGSEGDGPALPWGAGLYAGTFAIVSVDESEARLSCSVRGAFNEPAVRRLMESFHTLLADAVAEPTRRASALAILDDGALAEVLRRGRGPAEPAPAETPLGALHLQVLRSPEAIAVRTGAQALTYAELDDRSDRLADRLRALGTGPGCTVGVALEPSLEVAVATLAVWKAGAAWVALDPADAGERLSEIVHEASVKLVIGDPGRVSLAEHARVVPAAAEGGRQAASAGAPAGPDDAAVVFYGSARCAVDRAVVLDHRAVANLLAGLRRDLRNRPGATAGKRRVCLCPPTTHDAFLRRLVALLDGHCLHIPDRPLEADPQETIRLLSAADVDLVDCTPDEAGALLGAGLLEVEKAGGARVEPVLVVGTREGVAPDLWRALRELTGVCAHVVYGPPECAFAATASTSARAAGRPLANVASWVLDPRGHPVPARAVGELHIAGPGLCRGCPGPPDATDDRFVEHPLGGESTRLYRTGALARSFPDGSVEVLGPIEADCDLRGFRVEPARIRTALAGCPGVRDLTVTLQRDERGEPSLVARVVPDGRPPTLSQLRAHLWTRLPGYAWPTSLVVVAPLPGQSRGEPAARGGPPDDTSAAGAGPATGAPGGILRSLWGEVVGVERMASAENYWQAFSFIEALGRARDEGLSVPGEHVTSNRTIETLATALDAARRPGVSPES